jgi:hypothetical protein
MTKLIGGTIGDTPIKNIRDGSAFSAGIAQAADHSNTIFLVTGEKETINVNAGHLNFVGSASIGTTNAHTAKGWSNAFQFGGGTGDYVDFKTGVTSTENKYFTQAGGSSPVDLAVEMYVKSDVTLSGTNRGIFSYYSTVYCTMVYYSPGDEVFHYTNQTPWLSGTSSMSSADLGTDWHHIRVVYDASESDAYYFLDGTHVATKAGSGTNNFFFSATVASSSISLGRLYGWGGSNWDGQMCGFAASIGFTASTASFTPPTLSQMQSGDWINQGY